MLALGAAIAVLVALATGPLICETACRSDLVTAQLVVAVVGLVPVASFFYAAAKGRYQLAVLSFLAALLLYVAWGLLNDAAVHGWSDLRVF